MPTIPITRDSLRIDKRGRTPLELPRTACDTPLSFHHVMPLATLTALFNYFLEAELAKLDDTKLSRTFVRFLKATGSDISDVEKFHQCIVAARTGVKLEITDDFDPAAVVDLIHLNAKWPRWNIVEGPTDRADDPAVEDGKAADNGFDRLDRLKGLPGKYQRLYATLHILNASIYSYLEKVRKGEAVGSTDERNFDRHISALERATARADLTMIAYDPKYWERTDEEGEHRMSVRAGASRPSTASSDPADSPPALRGASRGIASSPRSPAGFFATPGFKKAADGGGFKIEKPKPTAAAVGFASGGR